MARKKTPLKQRVDKRLQNNANRQAAYKDIVEKKRVSKKSVEELKLLTNPEDTAENPITWERLMDWLANTGWVEGYIRKRISPMDAYLIEDFTQSIWVCILRVKKEYIMEVWSHGKGKFVNFMKRVIDLQLFSRAQTYKENKEWHHIHSLLDEDQWSLFENGNNHSTTIHAYPEKYNNPSGNRKKMVRVATELQDIIAEDENLITN